MSESKKPQPGLEPHDPEPQVVALGYQPNEKQAPTVLARGRGEIARNILERAAEAALCTCARPERADVLPGEADHAAVRDHRVQLGRLTHDHAGGCEAELGKIVFEECRDPVHPDLVELRDYLMTNRIRYRVSDVTNARGRVSGP